MRERGMRRMQEEAAAGNGPRDGSRSWRADGTPEALLDGVPAPVSLSLSHTAGRALAAVGDEASVVGCDLELFERRSAAFVGD